MEPFDVIDAPQVVIEMFNKTLDKSTKIKTFKAQHIHIHRKEPGLIHFDGDPIMCDADLDVRIESKGIKVVINPWADKSQRQPNFVQTAFSEFFYNIDLIRTDLIRQGKKLQALNRTIIKKLNI